MQRLRDTRYFTYIFISLWKMLCFFCCLLLILFLRGESVPNFFILFTDAFSARQIVVTEVKISLFFKKNHYQYARQNIELLVHFIFKNQMSHDTSLLELSSSLSVIVIKLYEPYFCSTYFHLMLISMKS